MNDNLIKSFSKVLLLVAVLFLAVGIYSYQQFYINVNPLNLWKEDVYEQNPGSSDSNLPVSIQQCISQTYFPQDFAPSQMIVKFKNNLSKPEVDAILKQYDLEMLYPSDSDERLKLNLFVLIKTPIGKEKEFSCMFNELSDIDYAELNGIAYHTDENRVR